MEDRMQLWEAFLRVVSAELQPKMPAWYASYRGAQGREDIEGFLVYMEAEGLLTRPMVQSLRIAWQAASFQSRVAGGLEAGEDDELDGATMMGADYVSPFAASKLTEASTVAPKVAVPDPKAAVVMAKNSASSGSLAKVSKAAEKEEDEAPVEAFLPTLMAQPKAQGAKAPSKGQKPGRRAVQEGEWVLEDPHHRVVESIGEGGMGYVFNAWEDTLGRNVAFKQLKPTLRHDQEAMGRFLREARVTAQLSHPSIVPVYQLVKGVDGLPAYTMKIIEGDTLASLILSARKAYEKGEEIPESLSLEQRLEHFLKVCDAMAYAHSKGILHRDLKPGNVMIGPFGEVYVVDWGVARLMQEAQDQISIMPSDGGEFSTRIGQLIGTPNYMSPEQARGAIDQMDGRSDLFALGAILFELVFLKKAFEGDNLVVVLNKVNKGDIAPMVPNYPKQEKIPSDLVAIIRKACALEIKDRYASVQDLAEDLRHFLRNEPIKAAPWSAFRRIGRFLARRRAVLFALVVILVLLGAGSNFWYLSRQQEAKLEERKEQAELLRRLTELYQSGLKLDRFFYQAERLLGQLAASAQIALLPSETQKPQKFYLSEDFTPKDLQKSTFYQDSVSLEWPVIKLAPSAKQRFDRAKKDRPFQALLQRLVLLRGALYDTVFQSEEISVDGAKKRSHEVMLRSGFPISSSFVATQEGIELSYPGRSGYPDEYDPRERDWFTQASARRGFLWSDPFVSVHKSAQATLVCSTAILDKDKRFLGAAGIKIRLNEMTAHLGQIARGLPWARDAVLVDARGRVMARAFVQLPRFVQRTTKKILDLPRFHKEALLKQMAKKNKTSYLVERQGVVSELWAYTPLESVGWYLVVSSEWR